MTAEVPPGFWGKILSATPVVMTAVASALAGLTSSEMTRAQYARSLAAQQQSKAGDQGGFFQAKGLRGAIQRSTLDLLHAGAVAAIENSHDLPPGFYRITDTTLTNAIRTALDRARAFDEATRSINQQRLTAWRTG